MSLFHGIWRQRAVRLRSLIFRRRIQLRRACHFLTSALSLLPIFTFLFEVIFRKILVENFRPHMPVRQPKSASTIFDEESFVRITGQCGKKSLDQMHNRSPSHLEVSTIVNNDYYFCEYR